jgi:hypothetical protein
VAAIAEAWARLPGGDIGLAMTRMYIAALAGLAVLAAGCDTAEPVMAQPEEAAAPAAVASKAMAPDSAPTSGEREDTELSCTYPVTADDSVTTLRQR